MLWHFLVLRLFHTQCAGATTFAAWSQRAPSEVMSALQQQPRAIAPSGDGTSSALPRETDIGDWKFVPPLRLGNASFSNGHVSPEAALAPIQEIIKDRRGAGVQLCLSINGYLRGGLANSMGVVNIVMSYAFGQNLHFVMPKILPIDHALGDEFAFMFGSNPVCSARTVSVWRSSCPASLMTTKQTRRPPLKELPMFTGCNVSEQMAHDWHKETSSVCGCDEFILVDTTNMTWSYDYSRTRTVLSRRYWENAPGAKSDWAALKFPLRTAMHVRLGDVEGLETPKYWTGASYAQLAKALASFIDAACLNITILTDGDASDGDIRDPLAMWTNHSAYNTHVLDINTPPAVSLNTMARADILIGGPSGFPRFAAVLGDAQVKLFIGEQTNSHPIGYLPSLTQIFPTSTNPDTVYRAARTKLRDNSRMWKLATACTNWLAASGSSSGVGSR